MGRICKAIVGIYITRSVAVSWIMAYHKVRFVLVECGMRARMHQFYDAFQAGKPDNGIFLHRVH